MSETVLQEAERLINGERQQTYGDASESFDRIASLWQSYFNNEIRITGLDVTNLMILLKVSRTKGTFHRDSYVDIGGYAGLGERLYDEAQKKDEFVRNEFVVRMERFDRPREWASLFDVPVGVVVTDSYGDFWRINPETGWLEIKFADEGKKAEWSDETSHKLNGAPLTMWDGFAPFKEVV
ncbi:hypothetical protein SEA_REFUGE_55 [Mycobacterium phage Refuge]|uniref:DUF6378 domain-containing protein n=1 Tax=Mycobacterium phage Refuge TaxID=2517967 RepID=A0A482JEB4_9CAUD|nr:phosphofructokinase [Mycobacterium phage Refuge]QBP31074.1 hypothetical protein SEA_REFUGE_55 [Mycobacterium phage Refuge]